MFATARIDLRRRSVLGVASDQIVGPRDQALQNRDAGVHFSGQLTLQIEHFGLPPLNIGGCRGERNADGFVAASQPLQFTIGIPRVTIDAGAKSELPFGQHPAEQDKTDDHHDLSLLHFHRMFVIGPDGDAAAVNATGRLSQSRRLGFIGGMNRFVRTIELWHAAASADRPGTVERCCEGWLDDEERTAADRFARPTTRHQHVIGRGMAKRLLADGEAGPEAMRDPRGIRIQYADQGKPHVTSPPAAVRPFNIAHTDGLVVCAIDRTGPNRPSHRVFEDARIGVDVERFARRTDPAIADRYFSRPEIDQLNNQPNPEHRWELFLKIWTLKESFIKAIGTGLRTPLADFAFEDLQSDRPRIRFLDPKLDDGTPWHFVSVRPRLGFIAAAAVSSGEPIQVDLREFESLARRSDRDHAG